MPRSPIPPFVLLIIVYHSDAAKLVAKTRGQLENTWIDKNRNPLNEAFAFMRYTLVPPPSLSLSLHQYCPLSLIPLFFSTITDLYQYSPPLRHTTNTHHH